MRELGRWTSRNKAIDTTKDRKGGKTVLNVCVSTRNTVL